MVTPVWILPDTYVVGPGPVAASTCLDLVPLRPVVFDVNGYYAALGLGVAASRREIREAYQRLDGQSSARLTYIVKQLLDPEVRARYDATPLGSLFYDAEIEDWQRRIRVHEMTTLLREGYADLAERLAGEDVGVSLDDLLMAGQDVDNPPLEAVGSGWGWGYYLQASRYQDEDGLHEWQAALVKALGQRGEHVRIAVGFSGDMESPWGVVEIGHQIVVFLREDERPDGALAQAAASRVVHHLNPTSEPRGGSHGDGEKVMSGFRTGAEAAQEASKAGANFARTHYFGLEDGKSCIVRFITDADKWLIVDQHQMVPTKKTPFAGWPTDAKWAEKRGAVCRKDPAFEYDDCYICDHIVDGKKVKNASARDWALACLREEVIENGQVVGYRDQTREVKITRDGKEETVVEKAIVVVNMGYKNFFSILKGFAGRYKTLLDRDYYIKREGSDQSTIYHIVPNDPITVEGPNGPEILDLRQPYFMDRYKTDIDLREVISDIASDEFYAKFFDPRFTVVEEKDGDKHTGYKVVPASGAEAVAAMQATGASEPDEGGVDPARLAALADRVKGYGGEAAAPASASSAEDGQKEPAPAVSGMRDFG